MKQYSLESKRSIYVHFHQLISSHKSFPWDCDWYSISSELHFIYDFDMNSVYLLMYYVLTASRPSTVNEREKDQDREAEDMSVMPFIRRSSH